MSIYEALLKKGYTHEHIMARRHPGTRTFTVIAAETPDAVPIVGISYGCDFRSEEETGVGEIYKALRGEDKDRWQMLPDRRGHVGHFEGIPSLIIATHAKLERPHVWGRDIKTLGWDKASGSKDAPKSWSEHYDQYWESSLPWTQKYGKGATRLQWKKVAELRQMASSLGIKKLPRDKAGIVSAIQTSPAYADTAENPDEWPGWFHDGSILVLRADRGIVADTLTLLRQAAVEGHLAVGGGRQVFGSGLGFYDARDVGPVLTKEREEHARWRNQELAALEPVMTTLRARGHNWYFLGNPRQDTDGQTVYWLNGVGTKWGQPFGWYSREELLAEKFMEDQKAKFEERAAGASK